MKRSASEFLGIPYGSTGESMLSKRFAILCALTILPAMAQIASRPISPLAAPVLTTLHSFAGGSDGSLPQAGVVIGPGGVLYGTAEQGGSSSSGVVFSLTPPASPGGSWTENTIYTSKGGDDGADPRQLVVGSTGLYGTTDEGGPSNDGTVFSLTPPASPGGSWTETILRSRLRRQRWVHSLRRRCNR